MNASNGSLIRKRKGSFKLTGSELRDLFLYKARQDIAWFTEFVFGYQVASHHRRWQELAGSHPRLILHAPIEHGKTEQMSIIRPLWEIGRNPRIRIAVVSASAEAQAEKILGVIRRTIDSNSRYRQVFPQVRPGTPWSKDAIAVQRKGDLKDWTVQATGVFGPINGSRLDLIVLDDILSFENTYTPKGRGKVLEWIESEVLGRLVDGGRLIFIGTAWHPEDAMFALARRAGFYHHLDKAMGENGEILWEKPAPGSPFGWTKERLTAKRAELGEFSYARQLLCEPRVDDTARCREEWFLRCYCERMRLGMNTPEGWRAITGVDLGIGTDRRHDLTCLFTIAVEPERKTRRVLDIQSGRWQMPEILERIFYTQRRFQSTACVESNAAQDYIRQALIQKDRSFPVEAHHTGLNKHDQAIGIESLFVELERGLWEIPDPERSVEIRAWIAECLSYHPEGHTGDRLMASWIALEGARNVKEPLKIW